MKDAAILSAPPRIPSMRKPPHFRHVIVRTLPAWSLHQRRFGSGDQAMWMVLFFATMVSLGAVGLLAASENQ
jgi:hypothetical protein